jgi:hypothetical protein
MRVPKTDISPHLDCPSSFGPRFSPALLSSEHLKHQPTLDSQHVELSRASSTLPLKSSASRLSMTCSSSTSELGKSTSGHSVFWLDPTSALSLLVSSFKRSTGVKILESWLHFMALLSYWLFFLATKLSTIEIIQRIT